MERTIADVVATIEAGEFYQDYDQSVADLRILRAAIGAGGQAVVCEHDWEKTREDACMFVCSKCRVAYDGNVLTDKPEGWTGKYQEPSSALSQPHPADERVASAMMLEAEAKLAAYAFDEDEEIEFSREDAVFVLSALSAKEV